MIGAGKYDLLCTMAREMSQAEGAAVLVFNGNRGSGFSVQASPELTLKLPEVLRFIAEQIEGKVRQDVTEEIGRRNS